MLYRLRQLLRAVTARITPEEQAFIVSLLQPPQLPLFASMPPFDQRHCLDVCQTLMRAGMDELALLRAALLHDIGKVDEHGQPIPLIYYGIFVILRKLAPKLYHRAAINGRGLLRPFAIHAMHEERTVTLLRMAGDDPAVITILADYAARRETSATRALAWADNLN